MLGMVAAPGTELFRLVRQNRLEWRAELSGAQLAQVHVGDACERATCRRHHRRTARCGRSRRCSTRTRASASRTSNSIAASNANTAASRRHVRQRHDHARSTRRPLTLPSDAIVLRDGHEYVFVLGADGRVALTKVDIGRRFGNGVEISAGLDGDAAGRRRRRCIPERRGRCSRRAAPPSRKPIMSSGGISRPGRSVSRSRRSSRSFC